MVDRTVKLSALVSIDELSKLQRIAEDDGVPTSQLLRRLIRSEYQKRFGNEKPRPTTPTLRGALDDLTGRAHLTGGNIAERMGIPLDSLVAGLNRLRKKGIVELVGTVGAGMAHSTWAVMVKGDVYAIAEAAKFDLDEPLYSDGD